MKPSIMLVMAAALLLSACQQSPTTPATTEPQVSYSALADDSEGLQPDGEHLVPALPAMSPELKEKWQIAWLADRDKNAWFWKIPKPDRKWLYECMGDVRRSEVIAQGSLETGTGNPREWIFIDARNRIAAGDLEPYREQCPDTMKAVEAYLPISAN